MHGPTGRHNSPGVWAAVSLAGAVSLSFLRSSSGDEIPVSVRDIRFAEGHPSLRFVLKNDSVERLIGWSFTFSVQYPDGSTEQQNVVYDCFAQVGVDKRELCLLQASGEREVETRVPLGLKSGQPPVKARVAVNWVSFEGGTWRGSREWVASLPELDLDRVRTWREILAVLEDCRRKGGEGVEALQVAWARLVRPRPVHPLKLLVACDLRRAIGRISEGRGDAAAEIDLLIRDIRRANGPLPPGREIGPP